MHVFKQCRYHNEASVQAIFKQGHRHYINIVLNVSALRELKWQPAEPIENDEKLLKPTKYAYLGLTSFSNLEDRIIRCLNHVQMAVVNEISRTASSIYLGLSYLRRRTLAISSYEAFFSLKVLKSSCRRTKFQLWTALRNFVAVSCPIERKSKTPEEVPLYSRCPGY